MRYFKVAVSALLGFAIGWVAAVAALSPVEGLLRLYRDGDVVLYELAFAAFAVACVGGFLFLRASIRHNWEGKRAMVPRYLIAFVSGVLTWFAFVILAGIFAAVVTGAEEGPFILVSDRVAWTWLQLSAGLVGLSSGWLTLRGLLWWDRRNWASAGVQRSRHEHPA